MRKRAKTTSITINKLYKYLNKKLHQCLSLPSVLINLVSEYFAFDYHLFYAKQDTGPVYAFVKNGINAWVKFITARELIGCDAREVWIINIGCGYLNINILPANTGDERIIYLDACTRKIKSDMPAETFGLISDVNNNMQVYSSEGFGCISKLVKSDFKSGEILEQDYEYPPLPAICRPTLVSKDWIAYFTENHIDGQYFGYIDRHLGKFKPRFHPKLNRCRPLVIIKNLVLMWNLESLKFILFDRFKNLIHTLNNWITHKHIKYYWEFVMDYDEDENCLYFAHDQDDEVYVYPNIMCDSSTFNLRSQWSKVKSGIKRLADKSTINNNKRGNNSDDVDIYTSNNLTIKKPRLVK